MTRWTAADTPDLTGRTVMITGAGSGIGLSSARELGRAGARVVLAVRNPVKGRQAAQKVPGDTEVVELDVADLGSIRALADGWSEPITVLVNNAGVMQLPLTRSRDGFEMQAATNFLGPFALTNLLLPHVTGRVVTLSTQLHRLGHLRLDDLNWRQRTYNSTAAYNDSKLCVTMFALELDRRLTAAGSPVRSVLAPRYRRDQPGGPRRRRPGHGEPADRVHRKRRGHRSALDAVRCHARHPRWLLYRPRRSWRYQGIPEGRPRLR
jgi:NAD(P)-dependent dehydrogenase (short-subunit alcohol dehydrogenase family)